MKHWLLLAGLVGCASGDEPATLPTTFTSASGSASASETASASGQTSSDATTSMDDSDADSDPTDTTDATGPSNTSGMTSSGSGSTAGGSGSSGGVDSEQPEDGMYSACGSVVDCIGLTACLTANDTGGQPIDPFCTAGSCKSPLAQCQPTPGGTAVPICLEVEIGGVMDSVCALDCSQGQECPAGMDCRTLTGGSICS